MSCFTGGKRTHNVLSESEESFLSSEESDSGSENNFKQKLSNPNKRFKRNFSSELNDNFQNCKEAISNKMATNENFNVSQQKYLQGRVRKNTCNSKNAINARENRLKKKMYIQNLEKNVEKYRTKNKQLTLLLENQSNLLADMKKEVQYFKSIVANNKDITRLLKCINQNTGLPVTTSLNKKLSIEKSHPWEDEQLSFNLLENGEFLNDHELNLPLIDSPFQFEEPTNLPTDIFEMSNDATTLFNQDINILNDEHNYNATSPESSVSDDLGVGVCLHISNHKLSLEFCSTCSENASSAWKS